MRPYRLTFAFVLALSFFACSDPKDETASSEENAASPGSVVAPTPAAPVDADATLTAPATAVAGSSLAIRWTGPGNAKDYIDLVPQGFTDTHGEITYAYLEQSVANTVQLRVPTTAGDYEIRYVLDLETNRKVKASHALVVTQPEATLEVTASAPAGSPISVQWTGPGGEGDYIDLVPQGSNATSGEITYAYTRAGNPAALVLAGTPGSYEVRYVLEGAGARQVLTRRPVTATPNTATLQAPNLTGPEAVIPVSWTGPGQPSDYIDLVPKGFAQTSGELSYFYTRSGPSGNLKAPPTAGEYEIRYVLDAPGGKVVVARLPIEVR